MTALNPIQSKESEKRNKSFETIAIKSFAPSAPDLTANKNLYIFKHLPAAPDGRRTLLHVPRSAMLSFAGLNMDGSPPCLPPKPPPPPPPALQNSPTLKVWRLEARNPDVDVELNSYPFKLKILVAATLLMGEDWMKASGVDLDNPP